MRHDILNMALSCNSSAHLGGGLSIVEIMAVLYGEILNFDPTNPHWEKRDRFILSKGHGVLGLYTALKEAGFISKETLTTFKTNGSDLIAHPVMNMDLAIESSNGSLGHGLSMGAGMAWAARKKQQTHQVYVLLGDGECNEGSIWEAAMFASHQRLSKLTALVDFNKMQSDGPSSTVLNLNNLPEIWRAFGWTVYEVDGHDVSALLRTLTTVSQQHMPCAVLAHTVKGKGISFMENNNEWHHNRLTQTLFSKAIEELEPIS